MSLKQSLVTIIIPHYNRPKKLQRCLGSVLNQTYSNIEVYVIDDASTQVVDFVPDSRVQILYNAHNFGPGPSRNIGLQQANGEFVAFMDSDDYWDDKFLEATMAALIENPAAAMAYTNGIDVDEHGKTLGIRRDRIKQLDRVLPEILSLHRHWGTSGCLWRKADIQNTQWIAARTWEDYAYDIDVAIHNNNIIGLEETLVYYDVSGMDRLSEKTSEDLMAEKVVAFQHISDALYASPWRIDARIKRAIRYLILINTLTCPNPNDQKILCEIFKLWNGLFNRLIWKMVSQMPNSLRSAFLELVTRVYRKQMR